MLVNITTGATGETVLGAGGTDWTLVSGTKTHRERSSCIDISRDQRKAEVNNKTQVGREREDCLCACVLFEDHS